jgi:hypothetical protein
MDVIPMGQAIKDTLKAPNRSKKAYFGWFPFKWKNHWQQSFNALRGNGRPFVAPILQTLILNRAPQETIDWADKVASWNFQRIIPCHFDSPIEANPHQFRQAFTFLEKKPSWSRDVSRSEHQLLPEADFVLLRALEDRLIRIGITPLPKDKV